MDVGNRVHRFRKRGKTRRERLNGQGIVIITENTADQTSRDAIRAWDRVKRLSKRTLELNTEKSAKALGGRQKKKGPIRDGAKGSLPRTRMRPSINLGKRSKISYKLIGRLGKKEKGGESLGSRQTASAGGWEKIHDNRKALYQPRKNPKGTRRRDADVENSCTLSLREMRHVVWLARQAACFKESTRTARQRPSLKCRIVTKKGSLEKRDGGQDLAVDRGRTERNRSSRRSETVITCS